MERTAARAESCLHVGPDLSTTTVDEGYEVCALGLGSLVIDRAGTLLAMRPENEERRAELEELFAHSVAPRLNQLRGTPSFHASGVSLGASAVGFLGRSGVGKSTLAASLAGRWPVVSDDSLSVSIEAGRPIVTPSGRTSRLRDDSVAHMRLGGSKHRIYGKQVVTLPTERDEVPLGCLYVLSASESEVSTERLSLRDGLLALAEHLHRIDPFDSALLAKEMSFLEAIVRQVPVRKLLYPRQFERIAEVADAILRDFEDDQRTGRSEALAK